MTISRQSLRLILVALSLFVVYAASANYSPRQFNDAASAYSAAWSLAQHGTLDLTDVSGMKPWTVQHEGKEFSDRYPGIFLWATPFYLLLGREDLITVYPAGIASATAATIAVVLLYKLLRRQANVRTSLVAAALAAFGTATWTVSADSLWSHGINQVCLLGAMLGIATGRHRIAGLLFGWAIFTRPHLALVAAATGLGQGLARRSWRPVLQVGVMSALGIVGLLGYNFLLFGEPALLVGAYEGRPGSAVHQATAGLPVLENIAGALISPVRGVLVMSPFLLLLLPGLARAWRVSPIWVRSSALGGLGYVTVQLLGNSFAGGTGFYSYRLTLEPLTACAPLLLYCWQEWTVCRRGRRVLFAILAGISVVQHAVGALAHTPTDDPRTLAWSRYLLTEDLAQATSWQLGVLLLITVATTAAAVYLVRCCGKDVPGDDGLRPHVTLGRQLSTDAPSDTTSDANPTPAAPIPVRPDSSAQTGRGR